MTSADDRLQAVRAAIARAAKIAGRDAGDVELVAVSKTLAAPAIEQLLAAGHRIFGENRVQEAAEKWPALSDRFPGVRLHMVGQLQSNKAEDAVRLFDCIHSLDRPSLVKAIAKASAKLDRKPRCFVQVDLADEPQKGGVPAQQLGALLARCRDADIDIAGLMCLPPAGEEPAPYFALLGELAQRHELKNLSMGMSEDFETAVMLGATHVRVGTALFGARG